MPHRKSTGAFVKPLSEDIIDTKKHIIEEVVKPVVKKSKKRKSGQIRGGSESGDGDVVSGNLVGSVRNETRENGENLSPAKKGRMTKDSKGPTIHASVEVSSPASVKMAVGSEVDVGNKKAKKKKNISVDNEVGQAVTDNHCEESGETKKGPLPEKKKQKNKRRLKKKKKKSTKAKAEPAANGTTNGDDVEKESDSKEELEVTEEKIREGASYLKAWKEDREHWKFNTRVQKWLVKNVLKESAVSDDLFPILVEYTNAGSIVVRKLALYIATILVMKAERKKTDLDNLKLKRARTIIQTIVLDE